MPRGQIVGRRPHLQTCIPLSTSGGIDEAPLPQCTLLCSICLRPGRPKCVARRAVPSEQSTNQRPSWHSGLQASINVGLRTNHDRWFVLRRREPSERSRRARMVCTAYRREVTIPNRSGTVPRIKRKVAGLTLLCSEVSPSITGRPRRHGIWQDGDVSERSDIHAKDKR